jgi:hypothetical protein
MKDSEREIRLRLKYVEVQLKKIMNESNSKKNMPFKRYPSLAHDTSPWEEGKSCMGVINESVFTADGSYFRIEISKINREKFFLFKKEQSKKNKEIDDLNNEIDRLYKDI